MKVSCLQEQLYKGLSVVGRAVSTKTTLPVLNNILIAVDDNRLKLSATNLEISVTVWIDAEITDEGKVTIPARLLTDFVANLPANDRVTLALDDSNLTLNVSSARFNANIKGISAEDFPSLPAVINTSFNAAMNANVLKDAINQVAFAASTDETRPVLTGIQTNFEGDSVTFASADAFRLAVRKASLAREASNPFTVILPARAMTELGRILSDGDTEVEISVTSNRSQALFKTDTFNFTSSLIEGTFPNYSAIMPKIHTTRVIADTGEMLRKVKVASLFAKDNGGNIVKVAVSPGEDLTPGSITLTANANEIGDNRSDMDATVDGDGGAIAFNCKYLTDVLNVLSTAQVAIEMQDATKPGVFKPVGSDDYTHIIMPMHLSNR